MTITALFKNGTFDGQVFELTKLIPSSAVMKPIFNNDDEVINYSSGKYKLDPDNQTSEGFQVYEWVGWDA